MLIIVMTDGQCLFSHINYDNDGDVDDGNNVMLIIVIVTIVMFMFIVIMIVNMCMQDRNNIYEYH